MAKFQFNKKFDLNVDFEQLNIIRKVVDKEVSYEAFQFQELDSILCSATEGPENISTIAHDYCTSFALGRGSTSPKLSQVDFLKLCEAGLQEFQQKPITQYYVLTSLTARGEFPFKMITIDDCKIRFAVSPHSNFMSVAFKSRRPSVTVTPHLFIFEIAMAPHLIDLGTRG